MTAAFRNRSKPRFVQKKICRHSHAHSPVVYQASMLRLEPLVSLEKDVFSKIPREHLLVPPKLAPRSSSEASAATWLNYKGAALSIIGRYNSDTIILSYIGFYEVRALERFEGCKRLFLL